MSTNIIRLPRRVRPLRKTYQSTTPYEVEREDQEDGSISYFVADMRPETYRTVAFSNDDSGGNPYAKFDAEQIARGLNMLIQYGMEKLPAIRRKPDDCGNDDE